jgi:hypothetical protein
LYPNQLAGDTSFEINLSSGLDWGDAGVLKWGLAEPAHYPVTRAENGARHKVVDGFHLGSSVDIDVDGAHSENYDGDDKDELPLGAGIAQSFIDQELADLQPAKVYKLQVDVNGIGPNRPGFLHAWIDYNHDGSWETFTGDHHSEIDPNTNEPVQVDVSEKLVFYSTEGDVPLVDDATSTDVGNVTLANGLNELWFRVPPQATKNCPALRVRLSTEDVLKPTGLAKDGEVEDYKLFTHSSDWHNTGIPEDVNKDAFVSPIDALLVINYLNNDVPSGGDGQLPVRSAADSGKPPLVDVNDDGFVSSIDALRVINYINSTNGEGEGEGEAEDALMAHYGLTLVTVTSASITDLVEPAASNVTVDIPSMASSERVREAQFAELDLARETSLETVLAEIGGEVSDLRDNEDGHDEFFASVQY